MRDGWLSDGADLGTCSPRPGATARRRAGHSSRRIPCRSERRSLPAATRGIDHRLRSPGYGRCFAVRRRNRRIPIASVSINRSWKSHGDEHAEADRRARLAGTARSPPRPHRSRPAHARCAGLRPGPLVTPTASAKHTLRALARRWMALTEEIAIHDQHLARRTAETSPTLREGFGVGAHTAAELLIIFGG